MSERSERAVETFSGGLNCAQAVAGAFAALCIGYVRDAVEIVEDLLRES